jgi:vacuolar-type H+-ATPase subunit H
MTELEVAGTDLVEILTRLTDEVERFDSMVLRQRKLIEHLAGHMNDLDNDQLNRQSERISAEAAQVVACARQALDELSRIAEPGEPRALQTAHRSSRARVLPRHRRSE